MAEVLATVEPRIRRLLDGGEFPEGDHSDRDHAEDGGGDPWANEAPALAGLAAASVQGLVALGREAGTRVRRLGHARAPVDRPLGPCQARWHGMDLHAGLVIPSGQRDRLERVCRYVLRPPVTSERLALTADGQVRLALRQPWADGTTAARTLLPVFARHLREVVVDGGPFAGLSTFDPQPLAAAAEWSLGAATMGVSGQGHNNRHRRD